MLLDSVYYIIIKCIDDINICEIRAIIVYNSIPGNVL